MQSPAAKVAATNPKAAVCRPINFTTWGNSDDNDLAAANPFPSETGGAAHAPAIAPKIKPEQAPKAPASVTRSRQPFVIVVAVNYFVMGGGGGDYIEEVEEGGKWEEFVAFLKKKVWEPKSI